MTPSARVGPYEILGPLGEGGMGEVYRARDPRIGREVALKVLHARGAVDPDRVRRFEQEARAAGLLNHPNILTVHDVGTVEGEPYLVTELLDGETLRERLSRGALPLERTLELGAQVARGLAAAHGKGVVHRDLKPENLFVTRDGRVKILDFGIAKLVQEGSGGLDALTTGPGTVAGVVIGTAAYMSPEQVTAGVLDYRSDIFSLGIVLHEMLSGRSPFARTTSVETMTAVLKEQPPGLAGDTRIPPAVDRLVRHCLEKAPDDRFQSARDLAFALETAVTPATPSAATAALPASTPPRRTTRGRIPSWSPIAAAIVAVAVTSWALRPPADPAPRFTRVVKLVATDAMESSPVVSPDGKWLAYLSDEGGRLNVWVRSLGGGRSVNLTAGVPDVFVTPGREIGGIDISPDGRQIVFPAAARPNVLANEQGTYVVDAPLGGTPRKIIAGALGARFSPDGARLAFVLPGGTAGDSIGVADTSGENMRVVLQVEGGMHAHWPAWSHDGRYIYFNRSAKSANSEPAEVHRIAMDGHGAEETVIATSRRAVFPYPWANGRGLVYSANPSSVDLALWWKPWSSDPVRMTTGVGEYSEARLSADGRRMVATAYDIRQGLAMLPLDGRAQAATRLTEGASGDIDPDMSPNGDRLTCSSTRAGDRNIWTMKPDGSDARQVTAGSAIDEWPAWAPDGRSIGFVSTRGDQSGIWVVSADGGPPRRVIVTNVLNTITWSPDGREIVYAAPRGGTASLFRVAVDGGIATVIPTPTAASAPHWSGVTNVIAYTASVLPSRAAPGRTWLALVRPSGEPVPLAHELRLGNGLLAWSPDGKYVAGLGVPGGAKAELWVMGVEDRRPPVRLIQFGEEERPRGITWTSDGRSIILGLQTRTADIVLFDGGS